jgi:outer membrane protein
MNTNNRALIAAAAVAALLCAASACADDEVWNNNFRLGSYSVFYHTKADDLAGPYVPPGVNLKALNLETLYVGYIRRLSSAFDLEVALGYPPLSKVAGKGPTTLGSVPFNGEVISSARWLSPAVLLEYRFLSESSKLQPYIGAGINYTAFYDRTSTAQGNAASGGPTKLSLSASVGPVGTVGLAYHFSGRWVVNASYSVARVDSDLKADTAGLIRTTHIAFGPQTLVVSGGYSF